MQILIMFQNPVKLFSYYILLIWAAVWITKRNTCQFTFIYICECGFTFRINLFGAGRWQASRLTYNNPSSSCSVQSQSTGTHKPEASLHVHHRKEHEHINYFNMTMKMLPWYCLWLPYLLQCSCFAYIMKLQIIMIILIQNFFQSERKQKQNSRSKIQFIVRLPRNFFCILCVSHASAVWIMWQNRNLEWQADLPFMQNIIIFLNLKISLKLDMHIKRKKTFTMETSNDTQGPP